MNEMYNSKFQKNLNFKKNFVTVHGLLTPEDVDERHYEYLQEKIDVINRARASSGDDLIELPTTPKDIKLAMMDPKLYAIGIMKL